MLDERLSHAIPAAIQTETSTRDSSVAEKVVVKAVDRHGTRSIKTIANMVKLFIIIEHQRT